MDLLKKPDHVSVTPLEKQLGEFCEFGTRTIVSESVVNLQDGKQRAIPTFINQFWTDKQRQGKHLHEIPYYACFKAALPRFFIERLTKREQVVYDPFMGRGTTIVESALTGRIPYGSDVNPLSILLTRPRLNPPSIEQVRSRLAEIHLADSSEAQGDLRVFYPLKTLRRLCAWRKYFLYRQKDGRLDSLDEWIWMVMLTRLHSHSKYAFSRRSNPPNINPSVAEQARLNRKNKEIKHPLYRPSPQDIPEIILRKTKELLRGCTPEDLENLGSVADRALLRTSRAEHNTGIPGKSVSLVMTSPPFLNVVDYGKINWLRCWFAGIDPEEIEFAHLNEEEWPPYMAKVFVDLFRVIEPGGHIAFEVGEVKKATITLEKDVVPCGVAAGFTPLLILINDHDFAKTMRIRRVKNNEEGTNTNRVVVFRKPDESRPLGA